MVLKRLLIMKLTDFYEQKKLPVTSVNDKVGDVVITAADVNAVSKKQIGILVPKLKDGVVPDTQLPDYAKLVNGKILNTVIPNATNDRVGGIILGFGFQNNNGTVNAIGTVTKKEKEEKIDIIKTDGAGNFVLTDNGKYAEIISATQTRISFSSVNQDNNVVFDGNLPIISMLSENDNYYVLQSDDVQYSENKTILHMTKYLINEKISAINSQWVVFVASAIKYIQVNQISQNYKNSILSNSLIYG